MAEQLSSYKPPLYNPREALIRKLSEAPLGHAEALLDAYEILQLLRDKGVLEVTKGVLGSGERVAGSVTETLQSEAVVTLLRNLTVLAKLVGGLNPEMLEDIQGALKLANDVKKKKAPSHFRVLTKLFGRDSRRSLGALADIAGIVGRHLGQHTAAKAMDTEHRKTMRHSA